MVKGNLRLVEIVCAVGIIFGSIGLIVSVFMRDQMLNEDSFELMRNMFMIITFVYVLDIKRGMEK